MSVPITSQGITVNVTVTQLVTVKGRFGHQVTFTAVGAPFSIPVEQHIAAVAAARLWSERVDRRRRRGRRQGDCRWTRTAESRSVLPGESDQAKGT